ncbi:uncharacterized protein Z520_08409 [Fonsecaea multimorphosa CBS 102226]|uniref:Uncharacterized protein n=1 Tax=Fonsecaea multimorphosa CBS 102226 TaxID=1442371 RepID=A0A0D2JQS0_9EURO|nr:uncharacterized protein Z520_08409 [Fonsecaea multimorphosa CBS 102226]KIX95702.1 hypothetical protein Z520_08409 [Fonsecaea multimorphosa CBS 102226]OAL21439.1 hypothetical protein AYO22_07835 [Fonsecaea multimorphosa]
MSIDKGSNGGQGFVHPPAHPVPQLQKPFEESMLESISDQVAEDIPTDAMTRRTILLEAPTYQRVIAGRWKQKPGEKYHPLWKLVAQLTFGMHLLSQNMAISEDEVMRILQSHVDDIDAFLERTTEDFDLAQSDIHERIRCLKLPLAHGEVFDRMLEDRAFRASILDGNEKIDHVISRTKKAAKDALKDVQKGFDATNVMEKYLSKLNSTWKRDSPEHEAVLVAMLGNVEGWRRAFLELHLQGNKLAGSLKKLAEVVSEMQQRAAAVSRNLVARAQKTKHITSQDAGRAPSQLGSIAEHKPLPSEPGRKHSTRNSSRSTQLTSFSSRPNSGQKSSQGLASHPQSLGHQSPQSPKSRRPGNGEIPGRSFSSEALGPEGPQQAADRMHSLGGLLIQHSEEQLVELPADVPEDVLRQAPVSIKNRLSMTLGLKPKDNASHRISSVYYPTALADLLRSPGLSSLLLTPQTGKSKGTPVQAMISPVMSEGEAGFFLSHDQDASIGIFNADHQKDTDSAKASPTAAQASARASIVDPSRPVTRRSSIPNPAFTSHPAVMAMASPPVELPAPVEPAVGEERSNSSTSRKGSQLSSLGEPGPELNEGEMTRSTSGSALSTKILIDTSTITVAIVPASAKEETFAAAQQKAEDDTQIQLNGEFGATNSTDLPLGEVVAAPLQSQLTATVLLPTAEIENGGDGTKSQIPVEAPASIEGEITAKTNALDISNDTSPQEVDELTPKTEFIAELEAIVPKPLQPKPKEEVGPVELEAPQQTFNLPPRPVAVAKNPEEEAPSASKSQPDDFFKLPTELTIKPGMKPKDFGDSSTPEPIRPLKLKLTKKDGKIVPVPVPSPSVGSPGPKLKIDVVADIIDRLSYTPPGSPIHARSSSSVSSNSAQRWSHRSSRSLGPPEQAPAPPAPGGRPMVEPDFASAGQFDGERKQKKKKKKNSNAGRESKSGWKSLFRGSIADSSSGGGAKSSERGSIITTTTAAATTTTNPSALASRTGSEAAPTPIADMMMTSGKDVLWFKGDTKK